MSQIIEQLQPLFKAHGIQVADQQLEQMDQYYQCLVQENKKYNLTAITAPKEAAERHFFDSLVPVELIPKGSSVIDVGSGGGFPAVPIQILRPDVQVTALEATGKKCKFIRLAAEQAGIELKVIQGRAEELAESEHRGSFDVCTARAVADLPVLLELCAGLIRPTGLFLAYKGGAADEERIRSHAAAHKLGMIYQEGISTPLPGFDTRVLVYRKKGKLATQYPRNYGQIRKKPL